MKRKKELEKKPYEPEFYLNVYEYKQVVAVVFVTLNDTIKEFQRYQKFNR